MKLNTDPSWLREKAEREADGCVSVGGVLPMLDLHPEHRDSIDIAIAALEDEPVTLDWLRTLPGVEAADLVDLYSPVVFRNEFMVLQFSGEDSRVRGWAETRHGTRELRCRITRPNVLVLLAAFGPPVPEGEG